MMISVKKRVEKGVQKSVRANLLGMWMKVLTATDVGKDLRYNAFSSWPIADHEQRRKSTHRTTSPSHLAENGFVLD